MATAHRFLFVTFPVYNPYAEPTDEFQVPEYLMDEGEAGMPRRDRSGWMRNELKPPEMGTADNLITMLKRLSKELAECTANLKNSSVAHFSPAMCQENLLKVHLAVS